MSNTDVDRYAEDGELGGGHCVLMFSGGRDSTLAALRLHEAGLKPTLVTVTSDHLVGINNVRARLRELKHLLPSDTGWIHVDQPKNLFADKTFYHKTCLPCQHAYVVVAAKIAKSLGGRSIALGYASYQGGWPEQTELATARLKSALNNYGINLLLPVYDLKSKDDAIHHLKRYGLSDAALEQKCQQQVHNITLSQDLLVQQIDI
ncbi:MAG: hypothetical protein AAB570_00940, partial [Patescibacteria group bacterium]